ncbi:hypothetical protein ACIQ6V_32765 [Streptomyces sp. NPDC096198]|uniref:hypothetical protein n=1 Tax=Streptomyces sp. NPDC096198 TaxID=3366080 RepID=UPI0037F4DEF6
MSLIEELPRREIGLERDVPRATPAAFQATSEVIDPAQVASDMRDLASRVRSLMNLQKQEVLTLPLGGAFFDAIVTASGLAAYAAMRVMDGIQHTGDERADACGPVIEDPQRGWLIWLVPPGTSEQWTPHHSALCLGRPHDLALPAMTAVEPPGPYWLRPFRKDRLVPPVGLRRLLDQFQPSPPPHEALLGSALSTIS